LHQITPTRGALIGCGFVSQHHLEAWKRVPEAAIVAVCDLDPVRVDAARQRIPEAKGFLDAEELLLAVRPDFVEICTRPESHRPLVELAARHGAHVLCQKPSAHCREEIEAMIDACDTAGVRFMIHENWRFRPWYRKLRELIRAGAVGRPIRVRINHRDTRAIRLGGFDDQPYFARMPRLILFEMGPHLIDVARFLMGEVASVWARVDRFGEGHVGDDCVTLYMAFDSGAVGLLDMSWCAPAELARPEWALNETVVEGTAASLSVQRDGSILRASIQGDREILPSQLPPEASVYVEGYAATQRHLLSAIREGSPIETDGRDNLKTMDVIWAGYRSAQEGRWIEPPR